MAMSNTLVSRQTMNPDRQLDIDREWIKAEFGAQATDMLRELQYYNLYGELPPDTVAIEQVRWINDEPIVVHYDPDPSTAD